MASKSFTSTLLDVPSLTEDEDHAIKWSAASFYGGTYPRPSFLAVIHHSAPILGGADTVSEANSFKRANFNYSFVRVSRPCTHSSWP